MPSRPICSSLDYSVGTSSSRGLTPHARPLTKRHITTEGVLVADDVRRADGTTDPGGDRTEGRER